MVVVVNPTLVKNELDVQIGTGTIQKPEYPSYFYYDYGYFGFLYTSLEIGVSQPVTIKAIRFNMGESSGAETMSNQTVKFAQCNKNQFEINIRNDFTQVPLQPSPWLTSNKQTVKSNFTWTVPNNGPPWIEIQLDTPYLYDPNSSNSNLLIIWENNDGSYTSGSASPWSVCSTSGSLFRSYYDYQDNSINLVEAYENDSAEWEDLESYYRIDSDDQSGVDALDNFIESYSEASEKGQKTILKRYNNSRRITFLEKSKALIKGLREIYMKGVEINGQTYIPKFEGILKKRHIPFYYKRDIDYIRKARYKVFTSTLGRKYVPFK